MERLNNEQPSGISGNALKIWGLLFLVAGAIGRGLLQTRLLGVGTGSTEQLLAAMDANMGAATAAIVLQAIQSCATPIFAFLLLEGFQKTSNLRNYILRILGMALLSEIPYNLVVANQVWDLSTRNPAFSLVLGLVMLYLYDRFPGKNVRNVLIKVLVTVAALVWAKMLSIEDGACMVVILAGMWAFRAKPVMRSFAGATMAIVCTLFSYYYVAAPMGILAVHGYNGEKGNGSRLTNYLAYPALLLLVAGACWVVF